jgi:hypothetical protein
MCQINYLHMYINYFLIRYILFVMQNNPKRTYDAEKLQNVIFLMWHISSKFLVLH